MDQSGPVQNRRSRRSNLLMLATIELSGRAVSVKLRNLSADGARVEGDNLPVEGTHLLFRKDDLVTDARVIWADGKQAGLRFAEKLDPVDMLNHVPQTRRRIQADFRGPALSARELTAVERELAAQWLINPPNA